MTTGDVVHLRRYLADIRHAAALAKMIDYAVEEAQLSGLSDTADRLRSALLVLRKEAGLTSTNKECR